MDVRPKCCLRNGPIDFCQLLALKTQSNSFKWQNAFRCKGTRHETYIFSTSKFSQWDESRGKRSLFHFMSKCRSHSIKQKPRQVCFIHCGWIKSHNEAAVRSQTSADVNLNVMGSTNTNVWNKCSFQPLCEITRRARNLCKVTASCSGDGSLCPAGLIAKIRAWFLWPKTNSI